ncbi:MAG: DNA mismatch repair protein MutT [Anaerolineaceae bacterium]|nr:NUDIX domain-containing protein [Anaerolineae bacterium]MCL4824603.1 NUDIX domain-containing protein [Anaerolineales bacterium]MDL1925123.1 NUDIX domain-containing protein [Anaerolineae bacterium AMX1]GIK09748.1 MAG: DNA mismatch repair protein MutT [Chloroflexota bacterium]GJQ38734.1 MAG: DNA mismatch repair protein MutT [Anaerolineaceae bacterium]
MLRLLYFIYNLYLFIFRPVTIGVRVILAKEGRVLLVRHTYRDGWHLPGGGIQRRETVEAAARREVREEAGAEVGKVQLVGVYSNLEGYASGHNILFASEDFEIVGKPDREIAEARFFSRDELPADMFAGHRRKAEEYLDGKIPSNTGVW